MLFSLMPVMQFKMFSYFPEGACIDELDIFFFGKSAIPAVQLHSLSTHNVFVCTWRGQLSVNSAWMEWINSFRTSSEFLLLMGNVLTKPSSPEINEILSLIQSPQSHFPSFLIIIIVFLTPGKL
ncbi:hypothetical protein ILYODFUR_021405 [Ilyodon furcidens]|uniref:Uncharacterized protein n=1 Tax=Ilyodon furcidens TaxID=33524 RepID=A0ABV0SNG7_9TELE